MAGIREVARHAGIQPGQAQDLFQAVATMLGSGDYDHITIKGFGTFRLKKVPSRVLQTPIIDGGKPIRTTEGHTIHFSPSDAAKGRVSGLQKAKAERARSGVANRAK